MTDKAVLTIGDQKIELPILVGTEGETGHRHHASSATRPG